MPKHRTTLASKSRTSIFFRIFVRLTFPLLILAMLVSLFLLTNQVQSLKLFYQLESNFIFNAVSQTLGRVFSDPESSTAKESALRSLLEKTALPVPVGALSVREIFSRKMLVQGERPWDAFDDLAAEKSLEEKKRSHKPFTAEILKEENLLAGYVPIESPQGNTLLVARVLYPIRFFEDALKKSSFLLIVLISLILLTGVLIGISLSRIVVRPIQKLHRAVREIQKGNLNCELHLKTGDELETLAEGINAMTESLIAMQAKAYDANPLTSLPGNASIVEEVRKRISSRQRFVFFHSDLDRFKIFNDCYGIAKGDQMLVRTAQCLRDALNRFAPDDFLGHQGGDDFILIVKAAHAREVAEEVIRRFDPEVLKPVYPTEDYANKYTLFVDRRRMQERGESEAPTARIPLVSISLAGVSNVKRDFADMQDILRVSIDVKKSVKKKIESCYEIAE
ncbi:MAG: diguanylate cyclase domain-containing protein [Candidatus Omnitrophota bacterium]